MAAELNGPTLSEWLSKVYDGLLDSTKARPNALERIVILVAVMAANAIDAAIAEHERKHHGGTDAE